MQLRFWRAAPARRLPQQPMYFRPLVEGIEDRIVPSAVKFAPPALGPALVRELGQEASAALPLRVTSVAVQDGQLVANLSLGGQSFPVALDLVTPSAGSSVKPSAAASTTTPILDLHLNPIDLNLLGLKVDTSAICLGISATSGPGNLLGNLLTNVANLLNGGSTLGSVLGGLTSAQTSQLTSGLTRLLNGALADMTSRAAVTGATTNATTGNVLHLSVGPLNLHLLGLNVTLDNCANGPVTVDVTAVPGPGNLLGNLIGDLSNLLNQSPVSQGQLNRLIGQITGAIDNLLANAATPVVPLHITGLVPQGNGTFLVNGTLDGAPFTTTLTVSTQAPAAAAGTAAPAATTQILNLHLGPIHLDLLGLVVDTSQICLNVTAQSGPGNLLGNLLTDVANLLNGGITAGQLNELTGALTGLLNGALGAATSRAALSGATTNATTGNVLHLALGPVDLNLLGLNVMLDNCSGGPITVDVTAVPGPGNLLGNLIADLSNLLNQNPLNTNRIDALLGRITGAIDSLVGLL